MGDLGRQILRRFLIGLALSSCVAASWRPVRLSAEERSPEMEAFMGARSVDSM